MNYQVKSYVNRVSNSAIKRPEYSQERTQQCTQRSSSGKKIIFIRRKISNSSNVQQKPESTSILVQRHHEDNSSSPRHNKPPQISSYQKVHENKTISIGSSSDISRNGSPTYASNHESSSGSLATEQDMKISRGQFYEQELDDIQKELQFFRLQLKQAKQNNTQTQKLLRNKELETQAMMRNVYSFISRLFLSQLQLVSTCMEQLVHFQDRFQFQTLIQKSSAFQSLQSSPIHLSQFSEGMTLMAKILSSTLLSKANHNQIVKSQQITLQDSLQQIVSLKSQNHKISSQCNRLEKLIDKNKKPRHVHAQVQTVPCAINQKPSNNQQKTTDHSRQEILRKFQNAQIQTQEKRIGSAASIHKYKSFRFYNEQRNSLSKSNGKYERTSDHLKESLKPKRTLYQEVNKADQKGKINQQKVTINARCKKVNEIKKAPGTSSYLNHLIQSENLIKGYETVETMNATRDDLQNSKQNANAKSQLSIRRPIHRSRSNSHQEVPSSGSRSSSKNSINNISSRVYSSYSLNPINQYGQKRLCNQPNVKRIRKITQLSQESQDLEQRMKELMEQQQILKEKYKELEQVKVSREVRKSRLA